MQTRVFGGRPGFKSSGDKEFGIWGSTGLKRDMVGASLRLKEGQDSAVGGGRGEGMGEGPKGECRPTLKLEVC